MGGSVNQHWEQFIENASWFLHGKKPAKVGIARPPGSWTPVSSDFERLFPELEQLLRRAFVPSVAVAGERYELYAWLRPDGDSCSWLSPLRSGNPPSSLYADHRVLLRSFAGIVEFSNELDDPEQWWLLNHTDVLTEQGAQTDATFIEAYGWAFEEAGAEIPIDLQAFYAIAQGEN